MRVIFFGTSEVGIPILKALLQHHEVVHVVTSPDAAIGREKQIVASPIAKLAETNLIPISKPEKVKNNPEFLDFLKTQNADVFIVVSYGKILPPDLLSIPRLQTLNVHFSLLPKYRGPAPIQFALLNGDTVTGTTIFILDEQVDHGLILTSQKLAIEPRDTFETLAPKLADLSAQLLIDTLPKYEAGSITPQIQNEDEATFTQLINKEHGRINLTMSADEIFNRWRAYTPWPGIWTTYQGQVLKILECEIVNPPETPHSLDELTEIIPCNNHTFLRLLKVQLAGKNPVTTKDFLHGHKQFTPVSLGQ